jgi:SAM-dependent methyltransferase
MCNNDTFDDVIDFGGTPLVNSLVEEKDLDKTETVFPLEVVRCKKCSLVQTKKPIDSHEIYEAQDYLYFTGDMPQNSQYMLSFNSLVEEIEKYSDIGDLVVEIGSNDGTILGKVKNRRVLGVDPATNVVIRALKTMPTLSAPFNEQNAKNILKEWGEAQVVGGANCIAHIDDLDSVMKGVNALLAPNGVFWVECNYWGGMVKNSHYALIYHDHFSYFTLENWVNYTKKFSLNIFDAYITEAQGEGLSLRILMDRGSREQTQRMKDLLQEEVETELNSAKTCKKYNKAVQEKALKLKGLIVDLKKQGKKIAGYGAAAKGFSILHLAKITNELDYFVDDSPAKQGKYTPVNHIPIVSRIEAELMRLPDYWFITAPNYQSVIVAKEQEFLKNGGKFIFETGEILG